MASNQLANIEISVGGVPFYNAAPFYDGASPVDAAGGKGIFALLLRRWYLLVLFTVTALGTTELYLRRITPEYSSTARVCVQEPVAHFMGNSFAAPISPQFLDIQAEVINSVAVLELAETKLKSLHTPTGEPVTLKTFAGETHFLPHLQSGVTAVVDPKINSVEVSFISPYPDEAAEIANVIVQAYLESYEAKSFQDSAESLTAAEAVKSKREAELADGLEKLKALRIRHADIVGTEDLVSKITTLSTEVAKAQVTEAELQNNFGKNSPAWQIAVENERRLTGLLAAARGELASVQTGREELRQAQQDVDRLRDQADQADKLVKDTAAASIANHSGAARLVVFDDARPVLTPVRPRKMQLLGLAAILGLVLGGVTIVVLGQVDHRIFGPDDIVPILRVPNLGTVPKITGQKDPWSCGRQVQLNPMSIASEAYRAIWKSICFGVPRGEGGTILVTSPTAGNGKSTTASNLAIAMRRNGERVLLIDADFYKPGQHTRFGVENSLGFSSVLSGRCTLKEAIQQPASYGPDLLTNGPMPEHPGEVLHRGPLEALFREIREHYDWVVVDSPPVTTVSDTLTLAAFCDTTVLVVRAGKSTKTGAMAARDSLMSVGANLLGVVINAGKRGQGGLSGYQPYGAYGVRPQTAVRVPPAYADRGDMIKGRLVNGHAGTNGTNGNGQTSTDAGATREGQPTSQPVVKSPAVVKSQAETISDLAGQPYHVVVD
jgi:capsular exopolysaccharide synthesis family protein